MSSDEEHPLLDGESGSRTLKSVKQRAASNWEAFTDFALRDNVLEVAVGLILASAFTAVVNSFVTDILLPIISLIPFISRNLEQKLVILKRGTNHHATYNTIQQALDNGAVIWAWGNFVDKCIRLFIIALTLFFVARIYGWTSGDNIIKKQVKCKFCRKRISEKAKRCVNCTSWQDVSRNEA